MPRYQLITLGCKVNEYESAFYRESLEKEGFEPVEEQADVVLINTCTVTNKAAAKSRQMISRLKRRHPQALVAVIGCYATFLDADRQQELGIDLLIRDKKTMAQAISSAWKERQEGKPVSAILPLATQENGTPAFDAMPISRFSGQHRAFLKIQDGCNQYCAYCQIPYARGAERSWDVDSVIESARKLAEQGHLEIVLTGIHTGRYQDGSVHLAQLLQTLLENTPQEVSFRISSIEISEVDEALIELMRSTDRIEPHLHIPIQSASNPTLARMKRPYTVEEYKERIEAIRKAIPEVSISTDVIAGFVGESEEDFADTLKNLEEIGFSFLHVFGYSRREGTEADAMEGHLDPALIKDRVSRLLLLSKELRKRDMARFDHSRMLVERKDANGFYRGYTSQYHPARLKVPEGTILQGRIPVRLVGSQGGEYIAEYETV